MDQAVQSPIYLSIAAVERDTGLSKDTLRVWERRYGFPIPQRDPFGERIYTLDQVDRLRLLRRLLDAGHRPGKIIGLSDDVLRSLSEQIPSGFPPPTQDQMADLDLFMQLVRAHHVEELRRQLGQRRHRGGGAADRPSR
jgi:DNA-binding transcriptional MerR regulator